MGDLNRKNHAVTSVDKLFIKSTRVVMNAL